MKQILTKIIPVTLPALLLLVAVIGGGSAAEVMTAEIGALPNDVTVEQGRSASFEIWVAATGRLNCGITRANPATATLPTRVAISATGVVTTSAVSAALPFYAGVPLSTDCAANWNAAPGSYKVGAQVTAARGTPVGQYLLTLSQAMGTVVVANPSGLTPALADAFPTTVRLNVIAAVDTAPPLLTLPSDITAEAQGPSGAAVSYTASASDAFEGPVGIACRPASGSTFAIGSTAVNCSASDSSGNTAIGAFAVLVVDTTAPVLTLPADFAVQASSQAGIAVTYQASAVDTVDGALVVTCTPATGSTFAIGETAVNCIAVDSHGNSGSGSFVVTVLPPVPQDPVLDLPGDMVAEATGPGGATVTYAVTATDAQDGDLAPVCAPASGSLFPLDVETAVECSVTDSDGNAAQGSFTVTVVDTTGPVLSMPQGLTSGPTGPLGAWIFGRTTASDLVDGSVRARCDRLAWAWYPFGVTTVNCKASDAHGNVTTGSYDVTVSGFRFRGFYRPVENAPAINTVNAGSTVPIKWNLYGERDVVISSARAIAPGYPRAVVVACDSLTGGTVRSGSRGDQTRHSEGRSGQYVYRWRVPPDRDACYRFEVKFTDGSTQVAYFKTK